MSDNKSLNIAQRFDFEINEISDKLNQLESGRVMEKTHAQCDGYLATNVQQLRKMLNSLLSKIDNGEPSFSESIKPFF